MTRSRKSRKPGAAPMSAPSKEDKRKLLEPSNKKPKKHKGKVSGNRQQEAVKKPIQSSDNQANKDPRIGSKKPIVLTKTPKVAEQPVVKTPAKSSPIAPIRVVDNTQALEEELFAIEDDQSLQDIISKQEQEKALTADEVDFFNEKMTRHQELTEKLGWDNDDEPEVEQKKTDNDENALWDKLDNNSFSDFD